MTRQNATRQSSRVGRRIGYAVAIACNVALLVIVISILDWGWLPWLTEGFRRVLPFISVSLIASAVANAAYLVYEAPWFKGVAEFGLLVISLIATIRLLQVFPFDFSAYDFSWGTLTRWILGVAIFGTCVAMLVQVVRLVRMAMGTASARQPEG